MSALSRLAQMMRIGWTRAAAAASAIRLSDGSRLEDWAAGRRRSDFEAMSITTVYRATALISGAIAGLPIHVYREMKDGNRKRVNSPLDRILNRRMAPGWTAPVAWEYLMQSLLLRGNAFARIVRDGSVRGEVTALEPLHPKTVSVLYDPTRRTRIYEVSPQSWELNARASVDLRTRVIDQDDMIHIPAFGFDGLRGYSQLRASLETAMETASAAELMALSFFKNGAVPGFLLVGDKDMPALSQEQIEGLRAQFEDRHKGEARSHRTAIIHGGLRPEKIGISPDDAQMLSTRQFQVEEIARAFGIPPFMLGETAKSTSWGTGLEQTGAGFERWTLAPHLVKIQAELSDKLLSRPNQYVEFNTGALLRANTKEANESYRIALGRAGEAPWMTVDEVRARENLPALTPAQRAELTAAAKPDTGAGDDTETTTD